MRPVEKKQSKGDRPLRPKLPLRNRSKQTIKTALKNPEQQPSFKLTKQFILKNSLFWKQEGDLLTQIRSLVLSDTNLNSFESSDDFNVFQLSNIELLSLSKNKIISLHPLAELDTLIQVNLNNNLIFDITPLSFLEKLESLYINNNKVSDLEPLYGLINLKNVHLYNNLVPYRERDQVMQFCQRLQEFDIQKNQVYKQDEKNEWLKGKLRKFNGQPISIKMKNQIQMGSTAQSFRPFSSSLMSRPSTARPSTAINNIQNIHISLQNQVQQAEHTFIKLDNLYEQEIVNNVRLKQELERKQQKIKKKEQQNETRGELMQKINNLKQEISLIKPSIISVANPELKQLFEMTLKYQKHKLKMLNPQSKMETESIQKIENRVLKKNQQKPFHADQQLVFEDEESKEDRFQNSDDELQKLLRQNEQQLEGLKAQLDALK